MCEHRAAKKCPGMPTISCAKRPATVKRLQIARYDGVMREGHIHLYSHIRKCIAFSITAESFVR